GMQEGRSWVGWHNPFLEIITILSRLEANILERMHPFIPSHDGGVGILRPLLQWGLLGFIIMIANYNPMLVHKDIPRSSTMLKFRQKVNPKFRKLLMSGLA